MIKRKDVVQRIEGFERGRGLWRACFPSQHKITLIWGELNLYWRSVLEGLDEFSKFNLSWYNNLDIKI